MIVFVCVEVRIKQNNLNCIFAVVICMNIVVAAAAE